MGLGDLSLLFSSGRIPLDQVFEEDILGDDLDAWLAESSLMKRTFRNCAVIAGLIERRHPGQEKTGRQVTVNSDLIYNVLRRYEPDHILLRATRRDAARGLTDVRRLSDMLARAAGRSGRPRGGAIRCARAGAGRAHANGRAGAASCRRALCPPNYV